MALSIVDNTTTLFDMQSTTDNGGTWTALGSAASLTANVDIVKVGSGSISARLDGGASGAQGGMQITRGTPIDFDDAGTRRGMVAVWVQTTSQLGSGGIRLIAGVDASNNHEWIMATPDGSTGIVYPGGWVRCVVDLSETPDVTNGTMTATEWAAMDYFAIEFDIVTDIMGNIQTIYIDQMDALTAADIAAGTPAFEVIGTTTTAGTAINELSQLTTVTDLGAIVKTGNSSYSLNMPVIFGDIGTGTSTITSTNEYIFVPPHRFTAGFCKIVFDGGTGTNTSTWGSESGTPPDSVGSTGGSFVAGANGSFTLDFSNADSTNVFAGVIIDGANEILLTSTNTKLISTTIANSGSITLGSGGELRDSTITDSTAVSGVGAVNFQSTNPTDPEFRDNLLQNCIHALEWEGTGPATLDLRNIKFNNNTADLRYNHTSGLLTVNVLELGDTPTTSNGGGGGTITIINAVDITIECLDETDLTPVNGASVYVEETDGTLVTSGTTNTSGIFTDSINFSVDTDIVYKIRKSTLPIPRYFAVRRTGTITNVGFSTTVLMTPDLIAQQS